MNLNKFSKLMNLPTILALFLFTLLVYLPILLNPDLLLARNNDLQEQFWPIFYFIKEATIINHTPPLWNNLFFSGMPLLPDPQFSLFYPPNLLFIFLPTSLAFILLAFLHTLAGGVGIYLLTKKAFSLPKLACLFAAFLYIASPRLAGYLEAGHFGLVATLAWLPFLALAIIKTIKTPSFFWSMVSAISLSALFFLHTVTLFWAIVASFCLFLSCLILQLPLKKWLKPIIFICVSGLLTLGLTAVTLLPQLEWAPSTTRFLLLQDLDVYPKWFSKKEFLQVILFPWLSSGGVWQINTEKWLSLGLTPIFLSLLGWWKLERKFKIILIPVGLTIILIALNNASPIYQFLISQKWYLLMRVSTRLWFIPQILVIILAAKGLISIRKSKAIYFLGVLAIFELLITSWLMILKPISTETKQVPSELYQYLSKDKSKFRVFCLTRCLSQQTAAKTGLELVEGYNTLQQTNYYQHFWQLSGGYWNYYTLALPPMGSPEIKPDLYSLGLYNTKYLISTKALINSNLILDKDFNGYYLYRNLLLQPRAYFWSEGKSRGEAPILQYSPNHIRVDVSKQIGKSIILSEVYSQGWKAYLNSQTEVSVRETPNSLRLADFSPDTKYIDFIYQPSSYNLGKIITFFTLIIIVLKLLLWKKILARL